MARQFSRKKGTDALTEINVTPLIDLAFALLIIFMITAPLIEQKIDLQLPTTSFQTSPPLPEEKFETLSVNQEGFYFWGNELVTEAEIDYRLSQIALSSDQPILNIRGDKKVQYQRIITLIDLIKKYNLTRISLDTQVE